MFNIQIIITGENMRGLIISLLVIILTLGLYAGENTKSIIDVEGLKNKSCVEKVTQEIKKIEGVENVSVDLKSGKITIEHENVDFNSLNSAIINAGYKTAHKKSGKFHGVETEETHCTEEQRAKCNKPCSKKN